MPSLIAKQNGPILQIILNRPEKKNALGAETISRLTDIFSSIGHGVRLVHLSGRGQDFCAGADLQWMAASRNFSATENYRDAEKLSLMYKSMKACPVPILAQVQGNVFGGGIGLCCISDIVIAEERCAFALSETRRGLLPAIMMPFVLEKFGSSRARELVITGRTFSAEESRQYGLVHFVAPKENLFEKSREVIAQILLCAPDAVHESRKLIGSLEPDRDSGHLIEILAKRRVSPEAVEGLDAFFSRRPAAWAGGAWSLDENV